MKTTIGVICVLVLTVVQARGPGRRMLCNADFPIYVDCLTKEGLPEHIKTYWECRETAKPSVTDDVFFKEVCRDDDVRHEFADCIQKHKLNGTVPPVPTVCKKILGQRSLGKGVRRYLCANKERYECMKVKAPAEDLIVMDNCQKKAFPDVPTEQFLSVVCSNNDPSVVDSAEEFGLCMIKNTVTDNQGIYPPTYIKECRDAGDEKVKGHKFALQEKNILEFICGNNIRYECIENKASPRELSVLKQCQDKTFPDVTIEHFFNFICDFTSESVERQTEQWAECVAENSKVSRIEKGIPGYLMECTNLGQSLTPVSQAVKDFFCEQPVRYQCIQRAVSQATLIKMAECSDLTEEMILSKLCSTGTSEWVNKWTECITIATQDIDLKMLCL